MIDLREYHFIVDIIFFVLVLVFFYLFLYTKPKRSMNFYILRIGLIAVAGYSVTHTAMIACARFPQNVPTLWFRLLCLLPYICNFFSLNCLYAYIYYIPVERRKNKIKVRSIMSIFSMLYLLATLYVVFSGKMFSVVDGVTYMSLLADFHVVFGYIYVILFIIRNIINKKLIPNVISNIVFICGFIDMALFTAQFHARNYSILNIAYIVPFLIMFIFFHVERYDEYTGCQDRYAFESHCEEWRKLKVPFYVAVIKLPNLKYIDDNESKNSFQIIVSHACRKLENFVKASRVYMINSYTYAIILKENKKTKDHSAAVDIIKQAMAEGIEDYELTKTPDYKIITYKVKEDFESLSSHGFLTNYLFTKATKETGYYHDATEEDYKEASWRYYIEQQILDINRKKDLDDERVLCYVQPIFNVQSGTFKTAESLMRLKIDDKIIYPDVFIPLAEANECIHTLTLIILNKVCKYIHDNLQGYEFDALSINCSTTEFADKNLHKELLEIVRNNHVECHKIRLEITESTVLQDMQNVEYNMRKLNDSGINFYLDDFGTGYSNLERIVSLPFSTIKFDKSLLYKSLDNITLEQLVHSMINVFKDHNLIALVEGVEDEEQANYSINAGFEYIQGYNYAKPVPIERLTDYFKKK